MRTRLILLAALFLLHGVVTALALVEHGYWAIFEHGLADWAVRQVFSDLAVALLLVTGWIIRDARARGLNPWPYVLLTLPLGSFAPLAYLIRRELGAQSTVVDAAPAHA